MIKSFIIETSKEAGARVVEGSVPEPGDGKILWVDMDSFTEEDLKSLATRFSLDPYAVEDTLSGHQRPKIEVYDNHVFSIINVPSMSDSEFASNSVFIFFSDKWILTLHQGSIEIDRLIEERVKMRGLASILKSPAPDIVYYMFFDFAVDHFYPVMDDIEEMLNNIETYVTTQMQVKYQTNYNLAEFSRAFLKLRDNLLDLRKDVTPIRDIIGQIMRGSIPFVPNAHLKGFRDIYDHTFQIVETMESLRDKSFAIRDLHLNLITTSTNAIMKILTIVVVVFTPLSLIAGIYGTNFTAGFFQPGTGQWYGFYIMIGAMIALSAIMLFMFRRMKIL